MTERELIRAAQRAREFSYSPYSRFCVGAALLAKDGSVFTGCNVESASFSPTSCAERTAICKAVSEGVREFEMLAIVGGPKGSAGGFCAPCGVCRQMIAEFCPPDFKILLGDEECFETYTLGALLPVSFTDKDLSI